MKKLLNIVIFVLIIVLLFIIIYPQYQISKVHELKIGIDPSLNSEIVRLAKKMNPEKKYKLRITTINYNEPKNAFLALKNKEIDVAILPWFFILSKQNNISEFAKAMMVTQYKPTKTFFGIVGKGKEVPLKELLKKKIIGILSFYEDDLILLYKHLGIPEQYRKYKKGTEKELINLYKEGKVDALLIPEPFLTDYLKDMDLLYKSPFSKDISTPYPGVGYFLRKKIAEKKSYIAFRFRVLCNDILRNIGKDRDSVKTVIAKNRNMTLDNFSSIHLPDWYKIEEVEHFKGLTIEPFLARTSITVESKLSDIKTKDLFYQPAELTE